MYSAKDSLGHVSLRTTLSQNCFFLKLGYRLWNKILVLDIIFELCISPTGMNFQEIFKKQDACSSDQLLGEVFLALEFGYYRIFLRVK